MEFKGTKGKWTKIHVSNDRGDYHKVMAENVSICNITTRNDKQAKANAKLIASAPEMFEMLKDIMESLQEGESYHSSDIEQLLKKITE